MHQESADAAGFTASFGRSVQPPSKSLFVAALSPGQSCLDPGEWEICWHLEVLGIHSEISC